MASSAIHGLLPRRLPTVPSRRKVRIPRTSWTPNRNRYQKSATAVRGATDVPTVLPSLIFDFVPGTPPSWSPKVCTLHGRTLYRRRVENRTPDLTPADPSATLRPAPLGYGSLRVPGHRVLAARAASRPRIETLGGSTFPARFLKPGKDSHVTWLGGNKAKY